MDTKFTLRRQPALEFQQAVVGPSLTNRRHQTGFSFVLEWNA
jgi:hypothetical protein